jgi:hypothetical protein
MFSDKFREVLTKEGVVSITSWVDNEAHVVNTWNSYLVVAEGNRLLIPAYGMRHTEKNTSKNPQVLVTLGSKEVEGHRSLGAGFLVNGTATYLSEGAEYDSMKGKFSFLTRVLAVTVTSVKQTI